MIALSPAAVLAFSAPREQIYKKNMLVSIGWITAAWRVWHTEALWPLSLMVRYKTAKLPLPCHSTQSSCHSDR